MFSEFRNKDVNNNLTNFQKMVISLTLSFLIIFIFHDLLNNFWSKYNSKVSQYNIYFVIFFLIPFLVKISSKGIEIYYKFNSLISFLCKSLIFNIFFFILCFVICILFFINGSDYLIVGFMNLIFFTSIIFLLLNFLSFTPLLHKETHNYISIWGSQGSGKTVYLAILVSELMRDKNWEVMPEGDLKQIIKDIDTINKGSWPPGTTQAEFLKSGTSYKIVISKKKANALFVKPMMYILDFADPCGDYFEKYDSDKFSNDSYRYFERLAKSAGLLLILSPAKEYFNTNELKILLKANLTRIKLQFKTSGKIFIPIAVCISKVDKIFEEYENVNKNAKKLLIKLFDESILSIIEEYCENYKIFCFSSIGVAKDENSGKILSRIRINNGTELPPKDDNIKPFGLIEPLEWLLDNSNTKKGE